VRADARGSAHLASAEGGDALDVAVDPLLERLRRQALVCHEACGLLALVWQGGIVLHCSFIPRSPSTVARGGVTSSSSRASSSESNAASESYATSSSPSSEYADMVVVAVKGHLPRLLQARAMHPGRRPGVAMRAPQIRAHSTSHPNLEPRRVARSLSPCLSSSSAHKKYMAGLWRLAAYLAAAVALVGARSSTGDEVLVVLEPALKQEDYSLFFGGLKG
jgi:hypothetical protein